jgi:hypothetical protein
MPNWGQRKIYRIVDTFRLPFSDVLVAEHRNFALGRFGLDGSPRTPASSAMRAASFEVIHPTGNSQPRNAGVALPAPTAPGRSVCAPRRPKGIDMSESKKKPVGDRRAVAEARGNRRNTTDAEHHEAQAGVTESGVWQRGTTPGITVNLCSSELGVVASASGSALHDVLEMIEALKQTGLRRVKPFLTNGAGI